MSESTQGLSVCLKLNREKMSHALSELVVLADGSVNAGGNQLNATIEGKPCVVTLVSKV